MGEAAFGDVVMLSPKQGFRRWQIGDVTITKVVETEMLRSAAGAFPNSEPNGIEGLDWLSPEFVSDDGKLRFSFHALVIEAPSARIVVDTCFGNDKERSQAAFCDKLQLPFLRDLEAAGFPRDTIDYVLCTHLHSDHVGWNTMLVDGKWVPTFPKARYLLDRMEYEHSTRELEMAEGGVMSTILAETFGDSVAPLIDAGLVDLVSSDHRICDEISLIPTRGHTPGHVSVVIQSRGERAIITGDAMHHPCQLVHTHWSPGIDHDADAAADTRRAMIGLLSDTPTLVIGTHWAGVTAGHIVPDGKAHRLKF